MVKRPGLENLGFAYADTRVRISPSPPNMKHIKQKIILKKTLITISLILSFVFMCIFLFFFELILPPFDKYANTTFAPKFTWEKFNTIKIGESKAQIIEDFGEPFWIRRINANSDNEIQCLQYSKWGGKKILNFENITVEVCVDSENIVIARNIFNS